VKVTGFSGYASAVSQRRVGKRSLKSISHRICH
jgi:hypothetical protein